MWLIIKAALSFSPLFNSCPTSEKTFEYQGCSVSYEEMNKKDNCQPCGGILPCIMGFEPNKKIDVLTCLCEKNNKSAAQSFTREYMKSESYNFQNSSGQTAKPFNEEEITNVCNNIPEKFMYL